MAKSAPKPRGSKPSADADPAKPKRPKSAAASGRAKHGASSADAPAAPAPAVEPSVAGASADVLVWGDHPAAYLAAALLRYDGKLDVAHAPDGTVAPEDRLVTINPALFDLHPLLAGLRKTLAMQPAGGVEFLSDEAGVRSAFRADDVALYVAKYGDVRDAFRAVANGQGVRLLDSRDVRPVRADETGVDLTVDGRPLRTRAVIVADLPPSDRRPALGLPDTWEPGVLHRYTYLTLPRSAWNDGAERPTIPMSLDLAGTLCWGWVLPGDGTVQTAVLESLDGCGDRPAGKLLDHWLDVLARQGVLNTDAVAKADRASAVTIELPIAGALTQENVADRTLLIGPAGGFFTASGEDVYPNCWSALFAADVLRKAFKEPHLQDALGPFRQKWGATLGDYLRGPQQNLRFLLPLVYRNPVMTARLAEAILYGKSVVR